MKATKIAHTSFWGSHVNPSSFQTCVTWRLGEPGGQGEGLGEKAAVSLPPPPGPSAPNPAGEGRSSTNCRCQKVTEWILDSRRQWVPEHRYKHFWIFLGNQK